MPNQVKNKIAAIIAKKQTDHGFDANTFGPDDTNVPAMIHLFWKDGIADYPYIAVSGVNQNRSFKQMCLIQVEPEIKIIRGRIPKEVFQQLSEWIKLNRSIIVGHWNMDDDYLTGDVIAELVKPINKNLYEMANLSNMITDLPFLINIIKNERMQHDIRIKVYLNTKNVKNDNADAVYGVRPEFTCVHGEGVLSKKQEKALKLWADNNNDIIITFWDGKIKTVPELISKLKERKLLLSNQ